MSVVVLGLHERECSLELLERVAVSDEDLDKSLARLLDSPEIAEAVIVSTCLRTEVYAVLDRFHEGVANLTAFFAAHVDANAATSFALEDVLRVEYDDAAVRHLFEVAAGLDSAILGEGEILRQVRTAAERAHGRSRASGPILRELFRHALVVGERARTETAIAKGALSLAHVAVQVAADAIGGPIAERRVVVAGAGEMGAGIAHALESAGASDGVVIVNRTAAAAAAVAREIGARTAPLGDLAAEVAAADVIISATGAGTPVITAATVRDALRSRPGRSLVIVDAAVPRDVDPDVGSVDGVQLFDVDSLRMAAEEQMTSRRGEVGSVEAIIDAELEQYHLQQRSRSVAPLVTALRSRADELVSTEIDRLRGRLSDSELELIAETTRRVVAKLLHEPTTQLKSAAGSTRGERLAEAFRALFDL